MHGNFGVLHNFQKMPKEELLQHWQTMSTALIRDGQQNIEICCGNRKFSTTSFNKHGIIDLTRSVAHRDVSKYVGGTESLYHSACQ